MLEVERETTDEMEARLRALSRRFGALTDATRLMILRLLHLHGEMCPSQLLRRFEMTASAVSHHLAILQDCGLVEVRTEGRNRIYRLAPGEPSALLSASLTLLGSDTHQPAP